jgi:glycosyltransferase involved in cell wall biosynthesis
MRIGIVTTSFPRWRDDHRSPFIWEQARFLNELGMEITVLGMHMPTLSIQEIWQGIKILRPRYLPEKWENLQQDRAGLPASWNRSLGSRLELSAFLVTHWLACIRLGRQVDLLHAHWTISGLAAILSRPFHHKPVVMTLHGSDIRLAMDHKWMRIITRWVLQRSQTIITVSQSLAEKTVAIGIPLEKIRVIPDGVDVASIDPSGPQKEKRILFVGSLTEQKGVLQLLEGFMIFHTHHPDYQLVYIGDGPLAGELRKRIEEKHLADAVILRGSLPNSNTLAEMSQVQLLVLPSIDEGFGVVLLEAMASGTPCMGVRSGSIPEILDGKCGVLVADNRPSTLAAALGGFFAEPERWREYSRVARERVEALFDWPRIAGKIRECYMELVT